MIAIVFLVDGMRVKVAIWAFQQPNCFWFLLPEMKIVRVVANKEPIEHTRCHIVWSKMICCVQNARGADHRTAWLHGDQITWTLSYLWVLHERCAFCKGSMKLWGSGSKTCMKRYSEAYSWQSLSCCGINIWFFFLWCNYSGVLPDRWLYLRVVSEWCYLLDIYCSLRNVGQERTCLFIKFIFMLL